MIRLLPFLLLLACSGNDFAMKTDTGIGVEFEDATGTLRLDILPPGTVADGTLMPQSVIVAPDAYEGINATLHRTRTLTGSLLAEVTHGWSAAPTTLEFLPATLLAIPGGGLLGGSGVADETGAFSLSFPDYDEPLALAILPLDPAMAPMTILEEPPAGRTDWSQRLEPGIPVYGRLNGRVGTIEQGVGGVPMRLSKLVGETRVYGGVFQSDSSGWYVAQVDAPGDYELEILGGAASGDDRIAPYRVVDVMVEGEDGVEVDVELGDITEAQVEGRVTDAQGNRLPDARVRFTSRRLAGGLGSVVVETQSTDPAGDIFTSDLLSGVYDVEVWPKSEEGVVRASPERIGRVEVDGSANLGTVVLRPATTLTGHVSTVNGDSAPNTTVVATETGFGGYTFWGRTDEQGNFSFAVPSGELELTLTPSDPALGAITRLTIEDASALPGGLVLDAGTALDGQVVWDGVGVSLALVNVYDATTNALLGTVLTGEEGRFSVNVSIPAVDDTDTGDTGADTDTDTSDTGPTDTGGGDTASGGDSGADTGAADTGAADTGRADTGAADTGR